MMLPRRDSELGQDRRPQTKRIQLSGRRQEWQQLHDEVVESEDDRRRCCGADEPCGLLVGEQNNERHWKDDHCGNQQDHRTDHVFEQTGLMTARIAESVDKLTSTSPLRLPPSGNDGHSPEALHTSCATVCRVVRAAMVQRNTCVISGTTVAGTTRPRTRITFAQGAEARPRSVMRGTAPVPDAVPASASVPLAMSSNSWSEDNEMGLGVPL